MKRGSEFITNGNLIGIIESRSGKEKMEELRRDTLLKYCRKIGSSYVFRITSGRYEDKIFHTKNVSRIKPWSDV